jgi:hypothetical protein
VTVLKLEDEKDSKRTRMVLSRATRWSGQVTQGCQGMLQESRTEEKSQVTLTRFDKNMTWIGGQIRLLGTAGVAKIDT